MTARYQLRVKDANGDVQAITDSWRAFSYTKRVNTVGSSRGEFHISSPVVDALVLDSIIEVWRSDPENNIDWYEDFATLHRTWDHRLYANGLEVMFAYGQSYESIIGRAHILGYAGTAYTNKSGPAESVAKELVSEQMVTGELGRSWSPLSVEADLGQGVNVEGAYHWRNVLTVIQDIAAEAGAGGFGVVRIGDYEFEFRWYYPRLGTDRTEGSADPVVLSVENGSITDPIYVLSHIEERNAIIAAGQGESIHREQVIIEDPAATGASPLARTEYFQDARNIDTVAGLESRAREELSKRQFRESLHLKVLQTPGIMYGREYFLGDLVTCRFGDVVVDKQIVGVTVTLSGKETIDIETGDIP